MATAKFTFSSPPLHVLITLVSCACVALVLPIFTDSVSASLFGSALRAYLTMPFFFILLNLLIGALYVSSWRTPQGTRGQQEQEETDMEKMNEETHLGDASPGNTDISTDDIMTTATQVSTVTELSHDTARLQMQRKNRSRRLARSKSDGILSPAVVGKSPTELRAVPPLLKKAETFESARRRLRIKPVIVVADPPEDGQVAEEEVDKKAEDFIGKFYQRVKLQQRSFD